MIRRFASHAISSIVTLVKLEKYLNRESTEILIHAFVISKLDNCNAILYGLLKLFSAICS